MEGSLLEIKQALTGDRREPRAGVNKDIEAHINAARDMDSLLRAVSDHSLIAVPEHDIMVCKLCVPDFSPETKLDSSKTNVHGICRYAFSVGTAFPRPAVIPKPFSRLKESVKHHLASKRHVEAKQKHVRDAEHALSREKSNRSACRNSLMAAYHVIKHSMAHVMYEKTIVLCNMTGSGMGDLCHSSAQMHRFRDAFCDVILDGVARHVDRMPCVSLVADKVTVQHRTIDVRGIITIVPKAPCDQLIQSLVIGAPVVAHHDGDSLAQEWVETLTALKVNDTDKLAAICTDGQYHGADVPAKFLAKLQSRHPDYAARSKPPSVPCLWDGAHLVDLGESSARREVSCLWVQNVIDSISRVVKRFSYGKGQEMFRTASSRMGVETRGLLLWSETRFSPYAASVIEAFMTNIPVLVSALEDQLAESSSTSGRSAQSAEQRKDLQLLKGNYIHD